jgi:hypothetical protein
MNVDENSLPLLTDVADTGEVVEMFDLTGGKHPRFVDEMRRMQLESFPDYPHVPDQIGLDASLPAHRNGLIAAQWFYTVDGSTASYQIADINVSRRTHVVIFGTVEKSFRNLTFRGKRFYQWATVARRALVARVITSGWLGSIAESGDSALPVLCASGWIPLPVEYQAPVNLMRWRELGLETERLTLIWLPPDGLSPEQIAELQPRVYEPASASFLLDVYGLDPDIPWVARLCGSEVNRPRPTREPA